MTATFAEDWTTVLDGYVNCLKGRKEALSDYLSAHAGKPSLTLHSNCLPKYTTSPSEESNIVIKDCVSRVKNNFVKNSGSVRI